MLAKSGETNNLNAYMVNYVSIVLAYRTISTVKII